MVSRGVGTGRQSPRQGGRSPPSRDRPRLTRFRGGGWGDNRVARILPISRKMNLAFLLRLSRSCANSGRPGLLFAIGGVATNVSELFRPFKKTPFPRLALFIRCRWVDKLI